MSKDALEDVYASLKDEVREELLENIQPKIERLQILGDDIIAGLSEAKQPRRKPIKKPIIMAETAPKTEAKPIHKSALEDHIRAVLVARDESMTVFEIRDELLKEPTYRSYDPQTLYTMVSGRIGQMAGVRKVKNKYAARRRP